MTKPSTKPCKKCGSSDRNKNGRCRPCKNAQGRKEYAADLVVHRARSRDKGRKRYRADPATAAARCREWNSANPDRVKAARLKQYGLTIEEYRDQLAAQGGVCAICRQPETVVDSRSGKVRELVVDHCHVTGRPRGLLCNKCNTGLARFEDDLDRLRAAIDYLQPFNLGPRAPGN